MRYILKRVIYLFFCLLAVSSVSAFVPDEDVALHIIQTDTSQEIVYCKNSNCYLVHSINAFGACDKKSIFCSPFVSDNWEDWFFFGFENLGKEPKFAKIAFILARAMYLNSEAEIDPTTEELLTSLIEIDLSESGVNRLHAFALSFYLASRNTSDDTIHSDLGNMFRASIKSSPRIIADTFDQAVSFSERLFGEAPTDASAEVATHVRTFILDIFPNATTVDAIIPRSLTMLQNEQT